MNRAFEQAHGLFSLAWTERAALASSTASHLDLVLEAILLAALIGVPLGVLATRSRPMERVVVGLANVFQTVPSLALLGFLLGAGLPKDSIYRYLNVFAEVYSLVRGNYVDPPDEDNLLDGAYRGMVGGLDLFSGYLSKEEFQKIKGDPVGGPAETGIEVLRVPGGALIVSIAPGSAAEKFGIRPTDQIWSIEGVPTRQMAFVQLRRAQRGAEDSVVRMLIYHPKTQKREDLRIRRQIPSAAPFESKLSTLYSERTKRITIAKQPTSRRAGTSSTRTTSAERSLLWIGPRTIWRIIRASSTRSTVRRHPESKPGRDC